MYGKLDRFKLRLVDHAWGFYRAFAEDLEHNEQDYAYHFKDLGDLIFKINGYNNLGDLIKDLYSYEFDMIGYSNDETIEDLLSDIFK